jgi:4-amino-4-deoxy-L-arabinose transferase-like glycosyltransferase
MSLTAANRLGALAATVAALGMAALLVFAVWTLTAAHQPPALGIAAVCAIGFGAWLTPIAHIAAKVARREGRC